MLQARPALARQVGRPIAVGIRPEALDEPGRRNGADAGRLRGRVQAVEALGPEQLAHVEVDAKPVLAEDVLEGLVDVEEAEDLAEIRTEADADGSRATVVARLDASARVRPDEPIELAVDLRHLHFFDLASGEAIGLESAVEIDRVRLTLLDGSTFVVCDQRGDVDGVAAASGSSLPTRASSRARC